MSKYICDCKTIKVEILVEISILGFLNLELKKVCVTKCPTLSVDGDEEKTTQFIFAKFTTNISQSTRPV